MRGFTGGRGEGSAVTRFPISFVNGVYFGKTIVSKIFGKSSVNF